jgi:predicted dehydrogenase
MLRGATSRIVVSSEAAKRYRTALVGTGWWGMGISGEAMRSKRPEIVALCDINRRHLGPTAAQVESEAGNSPIRFGGSREMLGTTKPEIVIVGTPCPGIRWSGPRR